MGPRFEFSVVESASRSPNRLRGRARRRRRPRRGWPRRATIGPRSGRSS